MEGNDLKWFDLVACKDTLNHIHLCYAPEFSGLAAGDKVFISTRLSGPIVAGVLCVMTETKQSPVYDFITTAMQEQEPLQRVISRINVEDFDYEEEQ